MQKILDNQTYKLEEFINEVENADVYYEICQIGLRPKIYNCIKFDYQIITNKNENRIIKNVFSQFYTLYIFKKIEDYISIYENDIILQSKNKYIIQNLINTYSNQSFTLEKVKSKTYTLIIDFRNVGTDIIQYEKGQVTGTNILYFIFNVYNIHANSMFFYIYPIFVSWIEKNRIAINNVQLWKEFLSFNNLVGT